jgi:hypothetical protein
VRILRCAWEVPSIRVRGLVGCCAELLEVFKCARLLDLGCDVEAQEVAIQDQLVTEQGLHVSCSWPLPLPSLRVCRFVCLSVAGLEMLKQWMYTSRFPKSHTLRHLLVSSLLHALSGGSSRDRDALYLCVDRRSR